MFGVYLSEKLRNTQAPCPSSRWLTVVVCGLRSLEEQTICGDIVLSCSVTLAQIRGTALAEQASAL